MDCKMRKNKHLQIVTKGMMQQGNVDEGELLTPGSVLFHKPDFNVHIMAIMGVKTLIDVDVIKAKFPITLVKHPRFCSVVVGNLDRKDEELSWVRTNVDLDKHIIVPKIDLENIVSPSKFVEDYMYNLSKTTLDRSKPLWEFHILNIQTEDDVKSIGLFRIHHSLGDGTSLVSLLLALMRKVSDPNALPTIPVQRKRDDSTQKKFFLWRWIIGLLCLLKLSWNTMTDVLVFMATTMFLKDTNTPIKGGPGSEFTPRRMVYKTFSLDDMKFIKNAMNATINDVALGITEAGLSRYLNRRYGNNNGCKDVENAKEETNNLPQHIRLRSVLLMNLRPSAGIQALADMMEKDTNARWGNSVGYVLLPFKIGIRDDPLEYIRQAKATADRKKNSLEALFTFYIADIIVKFIGKLASALSHSVHSHITMAFSNLVGPVEEIGFYGHPMAFLAPTSYGQPHALMMNFQSYVNKMTVVLSVDESTIPDPHQLCDDIIWSLKLIKEAVIAQGLC